MTNTCLKFNCIMYAEDTTLHSFKKNIESTDVTREIYCLLNKVNYLFLKLVFKVNYNSIHLI